MGGFRNLKTRNVRWSPVEGDGLEHLTVGREDDSIVARSVVIGDRHGRPYGVRYTIICDPAWTMRSLDLETSEGRKLRLTTNGAGKWMDDEGNPLKAFDGCIDVDLSGTPFTNTLPIRRLELEPDDGSVELSMLYVPFDSFAPTVDAQRYTCLETARLYRYEAVDRTFAADLPVDEDGLVIDYPTLFERVT